MSKGHGSLLREGRGSPCPTGANWPLFLFFILLIFSEVGNSVSIESRAEPLQSSRGFYSPPVASVDPFSLSFPHPSLFLSILLPLPLLPRFLGLNAETVPIYCQYSLMCPKSGGGFAILGYNLAGKKHKIYIYPEYDFTTL